jgi:serine/threonine protein kinase
LTVVPRIGTEFAGYRLESVIDRGGMAVVYLADHIRLGRKVAIKILAEELSEDDLFRERFVRESRIAAGINHANIIPIFDAGEWEGLLYIVMRRVEGINLKALIAGEGPLDLDRSLTILGHVGSALDAAHDRGLVHRDVKPANILVLPRPHPDMPDQTYLTDFGLTRHRDSRSGLTSTGQFVGTIDYVAPEQIQGGATDARTDIYSLGCVLFEMLTGNPPFPRDNELAVIWAHLQSPVPKVSEVRPELPAEIDDVVTRAMAKSPEERYSSCREMVIAARAGSRSNTAPPTWSMPAPPIGSMPGAPTGSIPGAATGSVADASTGGIPGGPPRSVADASTGGIPGGPPGSVADASTGGIPGGPPGSVADASTGGNPGGPPGSPPDGPAEGFPGGPRADETIISVTGPATPVPAIEFATPSEPGADRPARSGFGRRALVPLLVLALVAFGTAGYFIGRGSVHAVPGSPTGTAAKGCTDIAGNPVKVGATSLFEGSLACLLSKHVPTNIRPNCQVLDGSADKALLPTQAVGGGTLHADVFLKCRVVHGDENFSAWYLFKHDRIDVGGDYLTVLTADHVSPDVGNLETATNCDQKQPFERRWFIAPGQPIGQTVVHTFTPQPIIRFYPSTGRFACWQDTALNRWIAWTDANLPVLALAEATGVGTFRNLQEWWASEAGPGHPAHA